MTVLSDESTGADKVGLLCTDGRSNAENHCKKAVNGADFYKSDAFYLPIH
jgi:hypothetical protein